MRKAVSFLLHIANADPELMERGGKLGDRATKLFRIKDDPVFADADRLAIVLEPSDWFIEQMIAEGAWELNPVSVENLKIVG